MKEVKDKLKQKQKSWAEEERARAMGKVRLVSRSFLTRILVDSPQPAPSVCRRRRRRLGGRCAETEKAQAARRAIGPYQEEVEEIEAGHLLERRRERVGYGFGARLRRRQ